MWIIYRTTFENETFFIMALEGVRKKYIHNFKKCGNPKMGFHRTMRRWCRNTKWQSYQILSVKQYTKFQFYIKNFLGCTKFLYYSYGLLCKSNYKHTNLCSVFDIHSIAIFPESIFIGFLLYITTQELQNQL